ACTARPRAGTNRPPGRGPGSWGSSPPAGASAAYIQDAIGLGLDATFDPVNGFRPIPGYGQDAFELTDTLPGSTYQRANYVSANIIWLPVDRMGVGFE